MHQCQWDYQQRKEKEECCPFPWMFDLSHGKSDIFRLMKRIAASNGKTNSAGSKPRFITSDWINILSFLSFLLSIVPVIPIARGFLNIHQVHQVLPHFFYYLHSLVIFKAGLLGFIWNTAILDDVWFSSAIAVSFGCCYFVPFFSPLHHFLTVASYQIPLDWPWPQNTLYWP